MHGTQLILVVSALLKIWNHESYIHRGAMGIATHAGEGAGASIGHIPSGMASYAHTGFYICLIFTEYWLTENHSA